MPITRRSGPRTLPANAFFSQFLGLRRLVKDGPAGVGTEVALNTRTHCRMPAIGMYRTGNLFTESFLELQREHLTVNMQVHTCYGSKAVLLANIYIV